MITTISQKEAREKELQELEQEKQAIALVKLTLKAQRDVALEKTHTPEKALKILKLAKQ